MASGEDAPTAEACDGFWCMVDQMYDQQGFMVLLFIALCFFFYKMVWKVWTSAMKGKDDEIERLVKERNFYQEKFFSERLSTQLTERRDDMNQGNGE